MSNVSVTATAAASWSEMQPPAVQPTAQQAAHFEQQLQLPTSAGPQYYEAPLLATAGPAGNWRSMMSDVGQVAEQFRADSAALEATDSVGTTSAPSQPAGEAQRTAEMFEKNMSRVAHMSYTMMNIGLITSTERMASENVRTLYQLG
jgi:hypothetical protein